MATQTMTTQESMYRPEPGPSTQQFAQTRGDAFVVPPRPLARLSYEGAPAERIISGASRCLPRSRSARLPSWRRLPLLPRSRARPSAAARSSRRR